MDYHFYHDHDQMAEQSVKTILAERTLDEINKEFDTRNRQTNFMSCESILQLVDEISKFMFQLHELRQFCRENILTTIIDKIDFQIKNLISCMSDYYKMYDTVTQNKKSIYWYFSTAKFVRKP
ncbi:MAG: hypothetical protein JW795_00655 [Chitinivibrionales bacterium]|nr:hypothetical protein [Chitinivibrionales bacterium]